MEDGIIERIQESYVNDKPSIAIATDGNIYRNMLMALGLTLILFGTY